MMGMKRSFDFVVKAASAAVFVFCTELWARRGRREDRSDNRAVPSASRLRVRRQAHSRRVIFAVEGTLDQFGTRMLAFSVEQVPVSSTAVIDLSEATPIAGDALAVFSRIFAAGRRVRLRGLSEDHHGLLSLPGISDVVGA
jgi:hypothetical protein